MIGGSSVEIPILLGGLLELESLKLGCQSLLVPASIVVKGLVLAPGCPTGRATGQGS